MLRPTPVTPFVECPHCGKLLEMGATYCSECREPISDEYAGLSAVTNVINTQACNLARDIHGRDLGLAVFVLAESVAIYLIDTRVFGSLYLFWLVVFQSVLQLIVIMVWYFRFGRFGPLGDTDYIQAAGHVKKSATLWLTILVLQLVVIIASRR